MLLDNENALHYGLMKDIFDVPEDTARYYTVAYCSIEADKLSQIKNIINLILASEDMALETDEYPLLDKILIAASKVDIHLYAGGFTVISNGRIAQIGTSRLWKKKYSADIIIETLSNSEYYLQHREEFAEMERGQNYIYIKELDKEFPITDSIKKARTIEGWDFDALPLKVKKWMLDPMNIGIYDKEGHLIDFSDDEWDEYTEEDLKEMEKKRLAREERQKRK